MIRCLLVAAVVAALVAVACSEKARFDNYRVLSVVPETEEHLQLLRQLDDLPDGFSLWNHVRQVNVPVHIMVPPNKTADFRDFAERSGFQYEVFINDVQKLIDEQNNTPSSRAGSIDWSAYYRLDDIHSWLDSLERQYPGVVEVVVGGTSYEGRNIKGVKVSFKEGNPGVFIEGGIHAREWISPATVTYILNEILTSSDSKVRDIAENYDWYIFPNFNPDGYEYTHTHNRLWRKTRSLSSNGCYGADPNRNWGFHWMEGGASSSPCSDTYGGSSVFSEIEIKTMSDYITSIADKISVYLAFHNSGQMLLIPYGIVAPPIDDFELLMDIGTKAKTSLAQRYGTVYTVGNIVEVIYVASGSSIDWMHGEHGTRITFAYELRDTGRYGFLLPASQIIPVGEETLDSVVTILQEARNHI